MAHSYRAVGWNRQKRIYDGVLLAGVLLYLVVFVGVGLGVRPEVTAETLVIRATGTAAFLLLHVVLSIGPLCRLDRKFLPLLYNRRHLGVTMFLLAAVHGLFGLVQFHTLGVQHPLVSLLAGVGSDGIAWVPFQPLGLLALCILFLMAATSHDFWLANLSPPVWKALHMLVYIAYGLLILHVALGVLQVERRPLLTAVVGLGLAWVLGVHLLAAMRERTADRPPAGSAGPEGFVEIGRVDEIAERRARIVTLGGERVAVFRHDGKISAISNVCRHQNGPLGEGRIIDGCVTCPWHGFQYRPEDGASPPPFSEKVATFRVRLVGDRIWVDPRPQPPGTRLEPEVVGVETESLGEIGAADAASDAQSAEDFYIGYQPRARRRVAVSLRPVVGGLLLLAAAVGGLLAALQQPLGDGNFEYLQFRDYAGTLRQEPYPVLEVPNDGSYLLVAEGKHGAEREVATLSDRSVELEGALIERDGQRMIELVSETIDDRGGESPGAPGEVDLGERTLVGEIVDSKCYLGVMKPGEGKTHRACATLCIRGGIPPILLLRGAGEERRHLLLVDSAGGPVGDRLLPWVARPVEVRGRLMRRGELLVFAADPEEIRPLG